MRSLGKIAIGIVLYCAGLSGGYLGSRESEFVRDELRPYSAVGCTLIASAGLATFVVGLARDGEGQDVRGV